MLILGTINPKLTVPTEPRNRYKNKRLYLKTLGLFFVLLFYCVAIGYGVPDLGEENYLSKRLQIRQGYYTSLIGFSLIIIYSTATTINKKSQSKN
jgi:hypothetical protein